MFKCQNQIHLFSKNQDHSSLFALRRRGRLARLPQASPLLICCGCRLYMCCRRCYLSRYCAQVRLPSRVQYLGFALERAQSSSPVDARACFSRRCAGCQAWSHLGVSFLDNLDRILTSWRTEGFLSRRCPPASFSGLVSYLLLCVRICHPRCAHRRHCLCLAQKLRHPGPWGEPSWSPPRCFPLKAAFRI